MPSLRLNNHDDNIVAHQYDIAGQDNGVLENLLGHVGLVLEAKIYVTLNMNINVEHMAPPINRPKHMRVHVIGWLGLSNGQVNQIRMYVNEIKREYQAQKRRPKPLQQYIVRPHTKPVYNDKGMIIYYRYSCVGLVIESYKYAGIQLITENEEEIPCYTLSMLLSAFPYLAEHLIDQDMRTALGLDGTGPWPVQMPGFIMHSLNRTKDVIIETPYRPVSGDEIFVGIRDEA